MHRASIFCFPLFELKDSRKSDAITSTVDAVFRLGLVKRNEAAIQASLFGAR
jgi:hypothetical protein